MKKFILILLALNFLCQPSSCQDNGWFLLDPADVSSGNFLWPGLERPPVRQLSHHPETPRYEFFVIYSDGTCHNDYILPQELNHYSPMSGSNYSFKLSSVPAYGYVTSIYGDDDVPTANLVSISGPGQYDLNEHGLPQEISFSRQPRPGNDFTVIIDHKTLEVTEECSYTLCISLLDLTDDSKVLIPSPIFDNSSLLFIEGDERLATGKSVCFDKLKPSTDKAYSYVNIHMVNNGDSTNFIPNGIGVTLSSESCGTAGPFLAESIRDPHDPNFVKVACVSNSGNPNLVQYEIQCYNNVFGSQVDRLFFNISFPPTVDIENLIVTEAIIGGESLNVSNEVLNTRINHNTVRFSFKRPEPNIPEGHKDVLPLGQNVGNLKVCMPIKDGYDPSTVNLKPTEAISFFNTTPFHIDNYIDPCINSTRGKKKYGLDLKSNLDDFPVERNVVVGCKRATQPYCVCEISKPPIDIVGFLSKYWCILLIIPLILPGLRFFKSQN